LELAYGASAHSWAFVFSGAQNSVGDASSETHFLDGNPGSHFNPGQQVSEEAFGASAHSTAFSFSAAQKVVASIVSLETSFGGKHLWKSLLVLSYSQIRPSPQKLKLEYLLPHSFAFFPYGAGSLFFDTL